MSTNNMDVTGIMNIVIFFALIALALGVWNIVLIIRHWKDLKDWAKVMYIVFLFTGAGPLLSIILLYSRVGFIE